MTLAIPPVNMGGPSMEVVQLGKALRKLKAKPSALDLGAGTGRNSLYLAKIGFHVSAVERDRDLATRLRKNSLNNGVDIEIFRDSVEDFIAAQPLDLCLFLGILHFLELDLAQQVVVRQKSQSLPESIHVITVSTGDASFVGKNSLHRQGYLGSVSETDILKWYSDWDLLAHESYVKYDSHISGIIDAHPIVKFVFRYPTSIQTKGIRSNRFQLSESRTGIAEELLSEFAERKIPIEEIRNAFGQEDFSISHIDEPSRTGDLYSETGESGLKLCFWGRRKLYFEDSVLSGHALYLTDLFNSFSCTDG